MQKCQNTKAICQRDNNGLTHTQFKKIFIRNYSQFTWFPAVWKWKVVLALFKKSCHCETKFPFLTTAWLLSAFLKYSYHRQGMQQTHTKKEKSGTDITEACRWKAMWDYCISTETVEFHKFTTSHYQHVSEGRIFFWL